MRNIYDQMQADAESIVPGINLAALLAPPPARTRTYEHKAGIAQIVRSSSLYFTPSWLSAYYPVNENTLEAIKNNRKIRTI